MVWTGEQIILAVLLGLLVMSATINVMLRRRLRQAQHKNSVLEADLGQERQKSATVELLQQQQQVQQQEVAQLHQALRQSQAVATEAQVRLEEERKHAAQTLATMTQAREQLSQQFKLVAQEIFDERGQRLSELNQSQLSEVLSPFREQLEGFKKKVDEVYVNDVRERASLKQELEHLRQLNHQINQEAIQLSRALKGDHKIQGNWGELILERVLEQSGLRAGVEYETQNSYRDAEQRLLRPDVVIHLPEGKDVVVDSKVSLVDYETYCNCEELQEQQVALRKHVAAVRQHIAGLSGKDYSRLKGLRSLDMVLMFMPIESAFVAAFQADPSLFNYAFDRKIIVVTPTTLLATLRTIENIWRYERQNENAQAIAERAGAVYDKLRGFVEDMEKFGVQLANLDQTYTSAMNKLSQGRGNLISQASRFVELGVKVRKPLPKSIEERAEIDFDG